MKRDKINYLRQWRHDPIRVPLLLRGARQVGKSWLVQTFGQEFDYFIEINFEKDKRANALFTEHIDIAEFVKKLNVYTGKPIVPGKILLFLDEIQECPIALKYLRYFKEDYPQLHVIAAGSLIEFTLEKIGMAVGRVEYLYLYPLSFMEFLTAVGGSHFREFILKGEIDGATHQLLLEQLRHYMWLGGMPAVVQAWTEFKNVRVCQRLQDRIIENYQDDFLKYAKKHQIDAVNKVFLSAPKQLGNKFIYQHVDKESKTYPIKQALDLLIKAGICYPCFHTSAQNHQSWLDIVVLQRLFNKKIPVLKFFIKDQLKWIPLLGFAWWAMGCPFMKRYNKAYLAKNPHKKGKDLISTQKAINTFKQTPASIMSFIEGTRFTSEKKAQQDSPYTHLLKPKAGGISTVISAMGQHITSLVDVTIIYPNQQVSLWNFLCKRIDTIKIHVRQLPIPPQFTSASLAQDPQKQAEFKEWLNIKWAEKDFLIANSQTH